MSDDTLQEFDADCESAFPEFAFVLGAARRADGRLNGHDLIGEIAAKFQSADLVRELVSSLVPARVDPDAMAAWLLGSAPVPAPIQPADPTARSSHSVAGRLAIELRDEQRTADKVARLERQLEEARNALTTAQTKTRSTEQEMRVINTFVLLCSISEQTAGVFSMGPAWTLMRALSHYLQVDHALEAQLDENARHWFELHRQDRRRMVNRIFDALDLYCGDQRLEAALLVAIHKVVDEHDQKVRKRIDEKKARGEKLSVLEKRVRRSREEMHREVRADAPIADAPDVLCGLRDRDA